jgi:hypothetical protein
VSVLFDLLSVCEALQYLHVIVGQRHGGLLMRLRLQCGLDSWDSEMTLTNASEAAVAGLWR